MAAKNDAGLNKGEFVLFERIGRICELVHWVLPSDDAYTEWAAGNSAPGSLLMSPGSQRAAPV